MKSMLHLDDLAAPVRYESTVNVLSRCSPGVTFTIFRMSFGRRMELVRRIREISGRLKFLESSSEFEEKVEANLLAQQIEELYLRWGLAGIEGLTIDGELANTDLLIEKGPEELSKEISIAVKGQCGLTEQERKN
jgi:hypothetical protein